MIDVFLKGSRLCVSLRYGDPYYERCYLLVRSLLSAYEIDENVWSLNFHDFKILKEKLDLMGLVDKRTMMEDAYDWIEKCQNQQVLSREIKKGFDNQRILGLLSGIKTPLYTDQLNAVSYAVNFQRVGIFDEMGTGKTLEALAAIVALGPEIKKTLVICPYTVQIGFRREIQKHTDFKAITVPSGRENAIKFVRDNKDAAWDILLVHPENLIGGEGKGNIYGEVTKLLRAMKWDVIIVDEFHMYKNPEAKRTKCTLSILNESQNSQGSRPRAILLTGTPVSESPMNAYIALKVLSSDIIPHVSKFENHFVLTETRSYGSKGKHKKVVGYRNLNELKVLIEDVSIRRIKSDISGFPERVSKIRDVNLSGKQKLLYKAICGDIAKEISFQEIVNLNQFFSATYKVLRLRQLMNHPNLIEHEGESSKYVECDLVLDEVLADSEQKVVIWTEFRKAVENLYDRYDPVYGAVKIYGGISNEQLEEIAFDFENKDSPRVAICIPAKAGTGVDFLARARTAVYIDRPYSFTLYKQSIDRIHRRVATGNMSKLDEIRSKPATLIFLDVVNSVDELIRERLFKKQDMADALMTEDQKLLEIGRQDLLNYLK